MAVSEELLGLLVCPLTRVKLRRGSEQELEMVRSGLALGRLASREAVDWTVGQVDGLLVTEDGRRAYPVIDGIANLLPASAIAL